MSLVRPRLARAELEIVVGRSGPDHADPEIEASRSQLRQRRSQMLSLFDATHLTFVAHATWVGRFPRALDFVRSKTHHSI